MKYNLTLSNSIIFTQGTFAQFLRFATCQITLILILTGFATLPTFAQTIVEEGTYDLQFEEFVQGCGAGNNDYCINLQIKSASDVENFAIGSYTFYFTFNENAVNNPTYQAINFGNNGTCASGNAAYMTPAFFADTFTGEANVTAIMELPNQGCPTVGSNWQNIGLVCFEVIDDTESTQFAFGASFTEVNKNDDTPRHNQGTFSELDVFPVVSNTPANVNLAPNAPTIIALCSDESHNLTANVNTLSFGPQEGENPVVGWAISTTNPDTASPLIAEGYTALVLAGNPLTTVVNITGTANGLDPYGLDVATLWFSPITYVNYDEDSDTFTLDLQCFAWGTAVEVNYLANGTDGCPTSCAANVDLSDQIGQNIGICSDESVTLLADVNTLDFGENVGANPVVGWAIFTDIPEGGNPLDDPNYTGGIVAGNAMTTAFTVNGTNDGLDPLGFNSSSLSFVPMTFINYNPAAMPALTLDQTCFDWGEAVTVSFYADGQLDCPLPCDANVEVAADVNLMASLCVGDTYILKVNTVTLDFGVTEGANPIVGWVISTANPGELSPFGQAGFSGFALAGNGTNNSVTIGGTANGLDPYGLGVSTIWLTPVTYIDYNTSTHTFTLDDDCFDWGENVRITFVQEGTGICNPEPVCPSMAGDFSASEDLCDGGTPTVPGNETILNSLDDATNAVINWSIDPTLPLTYSGNGCEIQTVEFTLTITCSEDETVNIEAGTFTISLYPIPEAPIVVFNNAEICSYTVVPNCPNDVVSPAEVSDQVPGSTNISQSFTVTNGGCSAVAFNDISVPDCPEIPIVCPASVGNFSGLESICEMGLANVPTDETILASLDDPTNAVIDWSIDPTVPLVYEGDGCTPQQIDYVLTIRCTDNMDVVLNGGTYTVSVYPSPQAPTVNLVSATEFCSYELITNCENDILDPSTIENQVAGSGESVQTIKVTNGVCSDPISFDVTVPACPAICPTSAGFFNTTENLCDGNKPNLPSNETILAGVDLAERATINWSPNPNDPLIYTGDGCNAQAIIFNLTIGCQVDGGVQIAGGTHIVNLYPNPQAPTVELIENVDGMCSYSVVPACTNDIVNPSTISDLPAGSMSVLLSFNVANEGCTGKLFEEIAVPDCILDDIDPISLPHQLQMEVSPNFLQIGSKSKIEVYLPQSSFMALEVLDISGRRVKLLQQAELQQGVHGFEWNVEAVSSGLYFVHLQTEYGHEVRKVVVE
ncbi:MAG: T9SS type A sorting domain-containing protein [Chitinophagales bacterium]